MGERPMMRLVGLPEGDEPEAYKAIEKVAGYNDCKHRSMLVDPILRTVVCGRCGVTLDPVQCIIDMARADRVLDARVATIRQHQEKEASLRDEKLRKKMKAVVDLFGERWREFVDFGGFRPSARLWINTLRHKPTGRILGYSGSQFYRDETSEPITPAEALAMFPQPPETPAPDSKQENEDASRPTQ